MSEKTTLFNKENTGRAFPNPPPSGSMICGKILQQHSSNSQPLERVQYTCDCCRPVFSVKKNKTPPKKTATKKRFEVIHLLSSDDEDDDSDTDLAPARQRHPNKKPGDYSKSTSTPQNKPKLTSSKTSARKTVILSSSEEEEEDDKPSPFQQPFKQNFGGKSTTTEPRNQSTKKKAFIIESSSDEEEWNGNSNKNDGRGSDDEGSLNDLMQGLSVQDDNSKPTRTPSKPRYQQRLQDLNFSSDSDEASSDEDHYYKAEDDDDDLSFIVPDDDYETSGGEASSEESDFDIPPPVVFKKPSKPKPATKATTKPIAKPKRTETTTPKISLKEFKKRRESLAAETFARFDRDAFNGRLASVELSWSNTLRTTAGITKMVSIGRGTSQERKEAKIELAAKVIDDMDRLQATLLHEMVHAIAWLVDGGTGHGKCFQKWAMFAMQKIPGVVVSTTHSYEIEYKYAWACSNSNCSVVIKRHSRSIDVERQICGRCKGRLVEIEAPRRAEGKTGRGAINVDKTPRKKAPPSKYNLFIKENSKRVREQLIRERVARGDYTKVQQADVMKECGRLWTEQKAIL